MKAYSKPKKVNHPRYKYYVYYTDGNNKRTYKAFKTLAEAQNFSDLGNIQTQNAGFQVAGLSEEARREYIDAEKLLQPYSISVIEAVRIFANSMKDLEPYKADIPTAVKLFKKHSEAKKESISLFDAYGYYLDSLRAQGLSIRHIDSQEHRLERFINAMGSDKLVAMLDANKIEKWIFNLKACKFIEDKTAQQRKNGTYPKTMQETPNEASATTKNNYRTAISSFLEYCKIKGYISNNPIEKIKKIKEQAKEPEIYTVEEIRYILNCTEANSDLRAYIAIGCFAGLRRAEIERLTWDKIDLEDKTITLDGRIVKTGQRRVVNISDNLVAWLLPYSLKTRTTANVVDSNFNDRLENFIAKNNITWKHNALRHSSASYYLALCKDECKTALQMGHSVRVLKTSYKGLVKEKDAKRYFAILPEEAKITPVSEAFKKSATA